MYLQERKKGQELLFKAAKNVKEILSEEYIEKIKSLSEKLRIMSIFMSLEEEFLTQRHLKQLLRLKKRHTHTQRLFQAES